MKNVKSIFLIFLLVGIFQSCSKDDEVVSANDQSTNNQFISTVSADYLPDTDSSYWIYQLSRSDSNGLNTTVLGYDTMMVTTTQLNGLDYKQYSFQYFLLANPRMEHWYLRDTLGRFVNEEGKTMLDINALNSILWKDTLVPCYYYQYMMLPQTTSTVVPSGTYTDVVNFQTTFSFSPCPAPNGLPIQRVWNRLFAKNVGLIYESYGLTNDPTVSLYERKLTSYYLNN